MWTDFTGLAMRSGSTPYAGMLRWPHPPLNTTDRHQDHQVYHAQQPAHPLQIWTPARERLVQYTQCLIHHQLLSL